MFDTDIGRMYKVAQSAKQRRSRLHKISCVDLVQSVVFSPQLNTYLPINDFHRNFCCSFA